MSDFNNPVIDEFRANNGKVGGYFEKMKVLLLTTTGSKTGNQHTTPLAYTMDVDKYVVVASYGGAPVDPHWFKNIIKNPKVIVEVGNEKFTAVGSITDENTRQQLYAKHAEQYPQFLDYLEKTDRRIPVVLLTKIN